jgi:DNA-binding transcriptional LysR family regulator
MKHDRAPLAGPRNYLLVKNPGMQRWRYAVRGDNGESRVEVRIRKMHSLHPDMPAVNDVALEYLPVNNKAPKLGAIDLNLLVVFDAIMRDRSVTRAGQRLGLSQPAMSHALTRLRHMLKDDLFIRSPNGMTPTPRAEELATPVRIALDGLQQSLEPVQFEPSKASATFRIAVDNYSAIVLVAPIAAHIARAAPGVTLDFRPSGTLNVLEQLDRSELHLAMGPSGVQGERFSRRRLLQDQFVVVHRKGHPAVRAKEFSTEKLVALQQLEISSAKFGADFVDLAPGTAKPDLKAAMRAPFLAAAQILATSDLVAVLPLNVAKTMTGSHPLAFHRLSRPPKPIEAAMIWLRRLDNQPAHAWLRDMILRVTNELRGDVRYP